MNRCESVRRLACVLALAAGLWAGASPAGAQTAVPKPMDFGSDQVLAAVVVPDVDVLIRHVETVAIAFAPQEVKPGMIKAQLGELMGDPGLTQLQAGKPALLVILRSKEPTIPHEALYLPLKAPASYGEKLSNDWLKAKVLDDCVVICPRPGDLAAAEAFAPVYRKLGPEGIRGDLRLYAHVGRLMQVFGPPMRESLDGFLAQFTALIPADPVAPPGQAAGLAKLLKIEAKALLAALDWIDELQVDVTLAPEAVSADTVVTAKPGSPLVDLLAAPPPGPNPCAPLLSGPGVMTLSYRFDAGRLGAFMTRMVDAIAADPDAAAFLTPEVKALLGDTGKLFSGSMAMVLRSPDGKGFGSDFAMAVSDETALLAMLEKSAGLTAAGGPLGEFYRNLGMPLSMSLEKNVRQRDGVPVHRYRMALDVKNLPEAQAAQMKAMMKDAEFAFAKGLYLGSQDPAALDAMIDRALGKGSGGGLSSRAAKVFGEGRHGYYDIDVVGLMKATLSMLPAEANPMAGMLGALKPGEPMTFAVTLGDGRSLAQARIPLDPFIQLAKAAQAGMSPAAPPAEEKEK